ncbi:hypothetical protein E2C01_064645 [Portunus trituberculatus]|uniref:Uncharacterized protein n=1 Tax=Portunus trituberculatus TaxID=210409 RepID=A0A5B7HKB5_PORTR|nr:hypothetical protein [Portunus trituberculatus]
MEEEKATCQSRGGKLSANSASLPSHAAHTATPTHAAATTPASPTVTPSLIPPPTLTTPLSPTIHETPGPNTLTLSLPPLVSIFILHHHHLHQNTIYGPHHCHVTILPPLPHQSTFRFSLPLPATPATPTSVSLFLTDTQN